MTIAMPRAGSRERRRGTAGAARRRPSKAIRRRGRRGRARPHRRRGRVLRPARSERRGQDDDDRDLRGAHSARRGSVEVLGQRWDRDERALRERLGIQLQETKLAEKLTVEETVRLFRSFYARGREIDEVIDIVQLDEKRRARVGKLSRRPEAAARARLCARRRSRAALSRRADHRPRSAVAAPALGPHHGAQGERAEHRADDALHGRGGAVVRPRGDR